MDTVDHTYTYVDMHIRAFFCGDRSYSSTYMLVRSEDELIFHITLYSRVPMLLDKVSFNCIRVLRTSSLVLRAEVQKTIQTFRFNNISTTLPPLFTLTHNGSSSPLQARQPCPGILHPKNPRPNPPHQPVPPPIHPPKKLNQTNTTNSSLLSTTSNLDATLSTLTYTLSLLSHTIHPAKSSPRIRLLRLSALLSETRTTIRLFALLRLLPSLLSHLLSHPSPFSSTIPNKNDTLLASTQTAANLTFQFLENVAFLGAKRILPLSPATQARYYVLCSRAWALSVGCDLWRLGREYGDLWRKEQGAQPDDEATMTVQRGDEGMNTMQGENEKKTPETQHHDAYLSAELTRWRKQFLVTACWAPVAVHYSVEGGVLGEGTVALLGLVGSAVGLREGWRGV